MVIYIVHLSYRFNTAENAVCRPCSTVHQSNHFPTVLWASDFTEVPPFSSMVAKGHFSWYAFLNMWKHLLFAGDGFAGAQSIDSTMFSLVHETFWQMAPWLWKSIWLETSQMQCSLLGNFRETSSASCLSCTCRALPRANLHMFVFRA